MGHIGLTPQSIHALGGFKVQGKELDAAQALTDDAIALAEAGCFAIVLECVPDAVARMITESVPVPTIGIGAGRHCDGQVLVWHDILGFEAEGHRRPKFVRTYAEFERDAQMRDRAVLHRRARGNVPVERGDVPHDRPHDRGARPLRRPERGSTSPSSRNSDRVGVEARAADDSRPLIAVVSAIGIVVLAVQFGCGRRRRSRASPLGFEQRCGRARRSPATARRASRSTGGAGASRSPIPADCAPTASAAHVDLGRVRGDVVRRSTATAEASFTMAGVTQPLEIGWYTADGTRVGAAHMAPCPDRVEADCPIYASEPALSRRARATGRVGFRRPADAAAEQRIR